MNSNEKNLKYLLMMLKYTSLTYYFFYNSYGSLLKHS